MATTDSKPLFINFYIPENAGFYAAKLYKTLDPRSGDFRLLEILPGQGLDRITCNIIQPPGTRGLKYECISYRAGDPKEVLEIEVNGHSFNAFASLGAALRKIRLPDRSRVVWADQICINQNDVEERGSQVSKMRKFYEEAECVFAWLGHLEGGGLAFRTVQSLQSEFDIQMAGERNVRILTDVDAALRTVAMTAIEEILSGSPEAVAKYKAVGNMFRSELWGRLWIWQELIVAKRVHLEWATHSAEFGSLSTTLAIFCYLLVEWPPSTTKIQNVLTGNPPNEPETKIPEIFKINTRRRIWQQHKVLPLDRLLDTARWAYSSDPRDRVLALSGLGDPQLRIVPDYKASTSSVYTTTLAAIMAQGCSLDILAYCEHSGTAKSADLPTWWPDWSTESHATRVPLLYGDFPKICPFQASRCKPGVFRVVPDPLQRIGSLATDHQKTDEERFQDLLVLWAELVANEGMFGEEVFQELEKTAILENRDRDHVYPNMYFQHNAVYGARRFFVTSNGLMGMAPPHVKEGDIGCVLLGAQLPFLLRKDKDNGFYTLVGEVYISNGYMYGRAIDEMEAGTIQPQEFEIR